MGTDRRGGRFLSKAYVQRTFNQIDYDGDGKISYQEILGFVQENENCKLPGNIIKMVREKVNRNDGNTLDFEEFVELVNSSRYNNSMERYLNKYMKVLLPPPTPTKPSGRVREAQPREIPRGIDIPDFPTPFAAIKPVAVAFPAPKLLQQEGDEMVVPCLMQMVQEREDEKLFYEEEDEEEEEHIYSCWPPKLGMIAISLVEILLFVIDASMSYSWKEGIIAQALMYNPSRRIEIWRYLTYMLVHMGVWHLTVNILIQVMLGVPLEMAHTWWRVIIVYFCGVIAGSLGSSVINSRAWLTGASGGVYALITAHIVSVLINWKRMDYPLVQLCAFLVIICTDLGVSILNFSSGSADHTVSYAAHFFGGLAGLLVGAVVLKNYTVSGHDRIIALSLAAISITLVICAVLYNIIAYYNFPK